MRLCNAQTEFGVYTVEEESPEDTVRGKWRECLILLPVIETDLRVLRTLSV